VTQSAISAQIRRLTQIVGGSVLDRGPGVRLTRRGLIVLNYARRILMMNDELLMLAGPTQGPQQLVVGLPAWWEYQNLIDVVARCSTSPTGEKISFRSDQVGAPGQGYRGRVRRPRVPLQRAGFDGPEDHAMVRATVLDEISEAHARARRRDPAGELARNQARSGRA